MNIDKQKAVINDFWMRFRHYIIGACALIVVIIVLVMLGKWYANGRANELAERLRTQFQIENRALYDNLAVLKDRTQQLEYQYGFQKNELANLRNKMRGTTTNVFKSGDKNVIASFFDNTIDGYMPSK